MKYNVWLEIHTEVTKIVITIINLHHLLINCPTFQRLSLRPRKSFNSVYFTLTDTITNTSGQIMFWKPTTSGTRMFHQQLFQHMISYTPPTRTKSVNGSSRKNNSRIRSVVVFQVVEKHGSIWARCNKETILCDYGDRDDSIMKA